VKINAFASSLENQRYSTNKKNLMTFVEILKQSDPILKKYESKLQKKKSKKTLLSSCANFAMDAHCSAGDHPALWMWAIRFVRYLQSGLG